MCLFSPFLEMSHSQGTTQWKIKERLRISCNFNWFAQPCFRFWLSLCVCGIKRFKLLLKSESTLKKNGQPQGTGKICSLKRGFVISRLCFIYFTITGANKIVRFTGYFAIWGSLYPGCIGKKMKIRKMSRVSIWPPDRHLGTFLRHIYSFWRRKKYSFSRFLTSFNFLDAYIFYTYLRLKTTKKYCHTKINSNAQI